MLNCDTGGHTNSGTVYVKRKSYLALGGFMYQLGHGEAINVYCDDPRKDNFLSSQVLWRHGMKDLEFYEITKKEWKAVYSLFQDDRPLKDFEAGYWGSGDGMIAVNIRGRDFEDASRRYYKEHGYEPKIFDIDHATIRKMTKKLNDLKDGENESNT